MTPKQTLFVQEYLVDANATQAAIRAGYSAKTASSLGERLLRNVDISEAIDKAMLERAARTGVTADRVVQELANLAFFDPADIYDADGALKPISDIPPSARSAIAGLEIAEIRDSDGLPVGRAVKLKLVDRLGALDELMRHLGQYQDKITMRGDAENPLTLLVKAIQGNSIRPVAIRDQARADAVRTEALLKSSAHKGLTGAAVRELASEARTRLRLGEGGYRRDHVRAFAQRVEVADDAIYIKGSKNVLLRNLVAAKGGKSAGIGVPGFIPKWRRRRDSNPRDLFGVCSFSKRVPSASRPRLRFPSYAEAGAVLQGILSSSTGK